MPSDQSKSRIGHWLAWFGEIVELALLLLLLKVSILIKRGLER